MSLEAMKNSWFKWMLLLVVGSNFSFGQSVQFDDVNTTDYPNIPQEQIFVHYNTTLLFAGEYLYYKVYNLNPDSNRPSPYSKIAYVELINEDLQLIFKHKLRLEKGVGQGDFFIPTTVPSGNYKLLGYTQWMKNSDMGHFFQGDIAIINPYQSDQQKILIAKDSTSHENALLKQVRAKQLSLRPIRDKSIDLDMDTTVFKSRSKVTLDLQGLQQEHFGGEYSLSIRKIDTIGKPDRWTPKTFRASNINNDIIGTPKESHFYPPELRGELISGRVVPLDSAYPVDNIEVAVSIPEKQGYVLKVVTTNAQGAFFVNLEKKYNGNTAIVQVMGSARKNYKITLDNARLMDYVGLSFNSFQIIPEMKGMIIERSVQNQIENGYFSIKPDSLKPVPASIPLDQGRMITYMLDDYKRFQTVRETIVEVIDLVWSKRLDKDEYVFQVQPYRDDYYVDSESLPLVLVDGTPVQNQTHLLDYNAGNVRSIGFIRDKYVVGPKIFQGVLSIETFNGDYVPPFEGDHYTTVDLFKPQDTKRYYQQKYGEKAGSEMDRILDFRYQLLWEPNLELQEDRKTIEFFTSDIKGHFEICLEGFTKQGEPIALKQLIEVE